MRYVIVILCLCMCVCTGDDDSAQSARGVVREELVVFVVEMKIEWMFSSYWLSWKRHLH